MSNGTRRIRRALTLATAITALATPTAWGATAEQLLPSSTEGGDTREQPYTPQTTSSSSSGPVSGDGFDWGDAGIGATAMLAMAAIAGGGALVLRNRPRHDSAT